MCRSRGLPRSADAEHELDRLFIRVRLYDFFGFIPAGPVAPRAYSRTCVNCLRALQFEQGPTGKLAHPLWGSLVGSGVSGVDDARRAGDE